MIFWRLKQDVFAFLDIKVIGMEEEQTPSLSFPLQTGNSNLNTAQKSLNFLILFHYHL